VKNCPNCGAKLSVPELTPPESKKNTSEKAKKQIVQWVQKTKKQPNHQESEKPGKQLARKGKHNTSTPISPSHPGDAAKEDWFDSTGEDATGLHAVRSK